MTPGEAFIVIHKHTKDDQQFVFLPSGSHRIYYSLDFISSHFEEFQNFMYGNCFTFNTSKIGSRVSGTGPYNGKYS